MNKTSVDKAIEVTCSFEGLRGYTNVAGNFDKQGLSFGALQWNAGQHTLQPILRDSLDAIGHERGKEIFTNEGLYLLRKRLESNTGFYQWTTTLSVKDGKGRTVVIEPWYTRFYKLAQTPECQQIQRRAMGKYIIQAKTIMRLYGFTTERAFCLALDIAVQNGSVTPRAREEYKARINPAMNERARLAVLAKSVANTALPRWRDDVMSRKMAIVEGRGKVHGRERNFPEITDQPASYGEFQ